MEWTHNQGTSNYSRARLPVLIAHRFPCIRHRLLKYWLKIAIFWYPTSIWCPCWGWPRRNFTEWWGLQAMKKFDSKFGRFDTSAWQTDGQMDTARQQRPRYGLRHAVNIYAFSHYVVLIVCFCYTLVIINDCLVWSIIEKTKKINTRKLAHWQKLEITSQQRTGLNLDGINKNLSKLSAGMLRQGIFNIELS